MMLMLAIGGAALALSPFEAVFQGELYEGERLRLLIIGATATLMGICVFLPDHDQHSLRFLGEQAAPPRSVWVARQFTWICVLAIWAVIVHALWFIFHGGPQFLSAQQEFLNSHGWYDSHSWTYVGAFERLPPIALSLYITIGGFACGQLASMLVRSGILAGFIGLTLAGILYGWAQLIQLMEISWVWTLFPIPFVLLFVTWLRTRDWIAERNTWRGWLRSRHGSRRAACGPPDRRTALPHISDSRCRTGLLAGRVCSFNRTDPGCEGNRRHVPQRRGFSGLDGLGRLEQAIEREEAGVD